MNALTKNYVLDENQKTIAVQIPIAEFEHLEELLENYGLLQLMNDPVDSDRLSKADTLNYSQGDTIILSQAHLAQDWLTEIEDEAWQDL
jgi:RelB Antitoxin alpha helical domain